MMTHYTCGCGEVIIKSVGDLVKFRTKTVVIKGNQAFLVCKGCNSEVPIPLSFDRSFLNTSSENLHLFVVHRDK